MTPLRGWVAKSPAKSVGTRNRYSGTYRSCRHLLSLGFGVRHCAPLARRPGSARITLGFFLGRLSAVYSVADCERLVNDTISRLDAGLSTQVPVLNAPRDLGDVDRVIAGAQVTVPDNYVAVQMQARSLADRVDECRQASAIAAGCSESSMS